jgi:hypothetical protein
MTWRNIRQVAKGSPIEMLPVPFQSFAFQPCRRALWSSVMAGNAVKMGEREKNDGDQRRPWPSASGFAHFRDGPLQFSLPVLHA